MTVENQALHPLLSELTSGDDARAQTAVDQMARVPGEKLLPGLKELLSSPDPDLRWWAVRVLAEIDASECPDLLRKMVGDEDPAVQQCAVLALRKKPAPEAVRALAIMEDQRAIPLFYALLDSESALVTYWAEEGLSRLGVGMVFFDPGAG
ncbi:MAG: HEAT repeat domain-containing protein [Anaerolineales bacterium]|nr:HEAT repeat domain-containing protein [Anaerolineales bacterium]